MSNTSLARAVNEVVARSSATLWEDLDEATREATLRLVMDSLGVASGGLVAPGVRASISAFEELAGSGAIIVPWRAGTLPPADAGSLLSLLIHAWDFDDTHDIAVVHTGSVVVPAAMAAGQHVGASGRSFLEGVVAGVEIMCRLALAVGEQPGVIRTAGLGALGAAAAAAKILGLDEQGLHAALSLALPASMSPTSRQVIEDGAVSKRHQPGFACRHGITAAFLARAGIAGPAGWFSGSYGLGALVKDEAAALSRMTALAEWQVTQLSLKPYPACRYAHAAIAGTLELSRGLAAAEDIAAMRIHVPAGPAHEFVSRPWARRGQWLVDAQFSIPWLCAAALNNGSLGLDSLVGDALRDPAIEQRAATIEVIQDQPPGRSAMSPVCVAATRRDGSEEVVELDDVPGSPDWPLGMDDLVKKAEGCLRAAGEDPALAGVLQQVVRSLPGTDIRDALGILRFGGSPSSPAMPEGKR
jgi:2-methylcitrate dehydratase PrpD